MRADPPGSAATQPRPVDAAPRPGELGIRERRSWRSWQLVSAAALAAIVGMVIGHAGGSNGTAAVSNSYHLPPPEGGATATSEPSRSAPKRSAASSTARQDGSAATSTTATTGSTAATSTSATTAATSTTSTSPASGAAATDSVLLPAQQAVGSWSTASLSIGAAGWQLGWAYRCTSLTRGPAFQVLAVPAAGGAPTVLLAEVDDSGSGVATETRTGTFALQVEENASCTSVLKVVGVAGRGG